MLRIVGTRAKSVYANVLVSKALAGSTGNPVRIFLRPFSKETNDDFKKALNDVKDKYKNAPKVDEDGNVIDSSKAEEAPNTETAPAGQSMFGKMLDLGKAGINSFVDNVKIAYKEMVGQEKESFLIKDLNQDAKYVKTKPASKDDDDSNEEDETPADAGPSAIVLVKEGKSAWDQMKERLQEAPLIREALRRSRMATKAAASTNLGQAVTNVGRNVQDKISDAREFWETSQNPIVYTLSGTLEPLLM